jgi:lysozyme
MPTNNGSTRRPVAAIALAAAALVGIATSESFRGQAYIPVKGDVPTIGFGATEGVKLGDTITPERALIRLLADAGKYERAVRECVTVPLHQYEFDSFVSLTYNIGGGAFCGSTLVRKLNAGDYVGACAEISRWDKFQGKPLAGLTKRRALERAMCEGRSAFQTQEVH